MPQSIALFSGFHIIQLMPNRYYHKLILSGTDDALMATHVEVGKNDLKLLKLSFPEAKYLYVRCNYVLEE